MLYVERDLSAIVNAVFTQWDDSRNELNGKYLQASNARVTPMDITSSIEKGKVLNSQVFISRECWYTSMTVSGKRCHYIVLPTTGVPERDTMFQLYNEVGMHPGVQIPDAEVLKLGVEFHDVEDFIRDRLLPNLGLNALE
jgi:hypothetical protein